MQVRSSDGCVYFTASKPVRIAAGGKSSWDVNYVGPSILDAVSDFDRLSKPEGMYHYACGILYTDGSVSIVQFFCRALGWIIEKGKMRTSIFATLEADVKEAVRECEEATAVGG